LNRTARNSKLDTRSARAKLSQRREPYWTVVSAGCAIGYRRGKNGTWIARLRDETGRQHYQTLGAADDHRDADGLTVFSFSQAQERAREFFASKARALAGHTAPGDGPFTVNRALDEYLGARNRRGSKGVRADRYAADARIAPSLGALDVGALTTRRIRDWHEEVSSAPKRRRTSKSAASPATTAVDQSNAEAVHARRATANRLLTILKAALNHAFLESHVGSDEPWRKVKPFRETNAPLVRYLSPAECVRLFNACDPAFRALVQGALVTGCRYGELTRLRGSDFDATAGGLIIRLSKAGKPRNVALSAEGVQLFEMLTTGRSPRELIFRRADEKGWGMSHQQRPLAEASRRAKLDPPATFHLLRHTYASTLAMKGVPMGVIAAQLGHADTRMTERHYAHLAPSYVSDTIRNALPALGIVFEASIVPTREAARQQRPAVRQ
jgi:integrase